MKKKLQTVHPNPGPRQRYKEKVRQMIQEQGEELREDGTNWKKAAEIMTTAAKEVCGVKTRQIASLWTEGHE